MGRIINAYGDHDDNNDDDDGDDNDNDDNDVNDDGDFDEGGREQISLKVEGCLQVLADIQPIASTSQLPSRWGWWRWYNYDDCEDDINKAE